MEAKAQLRCHPPTNGPRPNGWWLAREGWSVRGPHYNKRDSTQPINCCSLSRCNTDTASPISTTGYRRKNLAGRHRNEKMTEPLGYNRKQVLLHFSLSVDKIIQSPADSIMNYFKCLKHFLTLKILNVKII